jgi:glycine dehydrogenase
VLGGKGLTEAAIFALLNANYMMHRLKDHYQVKFTNDHGLCAHEFLLDLAEFEKQAGIKVTDIAKRLQDYVGRFLLRWSCSFCRQSFHPPTCSWPISTGMLIEPTECENLQELDRFCDAMISIRQEIQDVIDGKQPKEGNVLKNAPHPVRVLTTDNWDRLVLSRLSDAADRFYRPYTRAQAVYPDVRLRKSKFWPAVGRLQESYGDLNLICECPSVEEVASLSPEEDGDAK